MKLACESRKANGQSDVELITAVLLMFTEQFMVASGVDRQVDSITPGAILLSNGVSLPCCPPLASEPYRAWQKCLANRMATKDCRLGV